MRYLRHNIIEEPDSSKWDEIDFSKPTFILNASSEFIDYIYRKNDIRVYSDSDVITGEEYYRSGLKTGGSALNSCVIVTRKDPYSIPVKNLELSVFNRLEMNSEWIKNPSKYLQDRQLVVSEIAYLKSLRNVEKAKEKYIMAIDAGNSRLLEYDNLRKKMRMLNRNGIKNGILEVLFENVIAEDTDVRGEDINLGDLTFAVDFLQNEVKLTDGSFPNWTEYNSRAFHPHHMSNGGICLGSQSSDMSQAIANFEIPIVKAMLHKFAHSYTSSDSAGAYYNRWVDGWEEREMVYSDYHDQDIYRDEAIYLDHLNDWFLEDVIVTLADGREHPSGWSRMCLDGNYRDEEEVLYSRYLSGWIASEDSVSMMNGEHMPAEHDAIFEFEDAHYYINDSTVDVITDIRIPIGRAIWSDHLQGYILDSTAIFRDGGYYTQEVWEKVEAQRLADEQAEIERLGNTPNNQSPETL